MKLPEILFNLNHYAAPGQVYTVKLKYSKIRLFRQSRYRELGFNQILLVEGPKDVKTIQQFLRLYKKDHQIILLPLGGKSLIRGPVDPELEEIKRISKNVYAIIDRERTAEGEELQPRIKEFIEACDRAKIKCKVLKLRAIEN